MATQIRTTAEKVLKSCEYTEERLRYSSFREDEERAEKARELSCVLVNVPSDTVVMLDIRDAILIGYSDD